jgi:ATP/maltotriose-dependent transcriptional regulator MalT
VSRSICLDGRMAWLNNGQGRYREALAAAEQGSLYPDDLSLGMWSLVELVEAAVRSGQMRRANVAFYELAAATSSGTSDLTLGIVARCRALVSQGAEAEGAYQKALQSLARTGVHLELARAHLLYGEWLRRIGRRVDARQELRYAHTIFTEMGFRGFAERAQRELLATGETVRKRGVETFGELTPQEAEVSRLAGEGYTNSEIATRLFLSNRTIEWHMRKIFTKLGIRSRRQLRDVVGDDHPVLSPL